MTPSDFQNIVDDYMRRRTLTLPARMLAAAGLAAVIAVAGFLIGVLTA